MNDEKQLAIEVEQYLKKLGLPVIQTEVGIGKRRLRPDLMGYSLNKDGDLVPQVVVEVKIKPNYIEAQQQLIYYAQHLEGVPYALLATPERKIWYDAKTFLQVEEPTFESNKFFLKESDILETLKSAKHFLASTGMLPYDILWTLCFSFFIRIYLKSTNHLSDWLSIRDEQGFTSMVSQALHHYNVDGPFKKVEIKPQGLKPEDMQQFISILNLVPPQHELLKKTIFSLIEDIGARYAGSYLTPVHLRNLFAGLAQQLNLEGKDVIDLSSGFGGLAFEIVDTIPVQSLKAIELNTEIGYLSKIISAIIGYQNIEIYQGDSLNSSSDNDENKLDKNKFSCVFIDPPLGKKVLEDNGYQNYFVTEGGKRRRVEFTELFIERALDLTKDDGEGYVIALVPEGILFNSANQITRDLIKSKAIIEAIISLPVQTLRPYSGVKLSVLVLRKKTYEYETATNLYIAQPDSIEDFQEVVSGFTKWKQGDI